MEYTDLLNKPFKSGGRGPEYYDCLGLLIELYRRQNILLEDIDIEVGQEEKASQILSDILSKPTWKQIYEPEVFCLVLIRQHPVFISHLGIYLNEGKFIHASYNGVIVERLSDPHYLKRIHGFYKYNRSY